MIVLCLTGSIGMGKSTVARMFAEFGMPVWSADEAVHRLYEPGGAGAEALRRLCPDVVGPEGVDRARLREAVLSDPGLLARIEAAVHPLVARDRVRFLDEARRAGFPIAVCEIPLLFESGAEKECDYVVVVSASPEAQRARVLERGGVSEEAFEAMLARQMPDGEKRARADFVIDTNRSKEETRAQVRRLIEHLLAEARKGEGDHA